MLIRKKMHVPSLEAAAVLFGSMVPCVTQQLGHHSFMWLVRATPNMDYHKYVFCIDAAICSNSWCWPKNPKQQQQ